MSIKLILHYHPGTGSGNTPQPNEGDDFGLMNAVVGIVALFLALLPFLIERIIRENREEIKKEAALLEEARKQTSKLLQDVELQAINAKCYAYYNRLMKDTNVHLDTISAQRLVDLFEKKFDKEDEILIALSGFVDLGKEKYARDIKHLRRIPETEQYLLKLSEYYQTKNPEISKQCRNLAFGRQSS